jgi:hypothetical protein
MKKIKLWRILVIALLAAAVTAGFSHVTVRQTVSVPYAHTRVMEQLLEPEQVAKWYQPFAGGGAVQTHGNEITLGEHKLSITGTSALAAGYRVSKGGNNKMLYFKALPDTLRRNYAEISLVYKTPLYKKIFGGGELERQALASLKGLKSRMEDTKAFYGFTIEEIKVTDTSFLFTTKTIPTAALKQGSEAVFAAMITHAQQWQLGYTGARIFNIRKLNDKETELYASIGISKNIITKPGEAYQFKAMPGGKNLLIARFDAPFKDIQQAFDALDSYRRDRGMLSMAMPFCKIMQEGTGFADDERVKLNVTLPVY